MILCQNDKKSKGKIIETPNKKDANKNLPGSVNLSDFQTKKPKNIGGRIVVRYRNKCV